MSYVLTDLGEEYALKTALEGASVQIALYNDATDAIGDTSDLANITTEPGGAAYARQSQTLAVTDVSGNWQAALSAAVTFDVSNSNNTVDSWALIANFQAVDTGDGAPTDHLIATGALSQAYDLFNLDSLEVSDAGFSVN